MDTDKELDVMREVLLVLSKLDEDGSKERVLAYVSSRLGLVLPPPALEESTLDRGRGSASQFDTFADFFNAMSPATNADRALAAGYWLQVYDRMEQFPSQAANKLLQDLGYAVGNITDAFTQLYSKNPRLALQVRKSGKSPQARKQYKLSQAGLESVSSRLKGAN